MKKISDLAPQEQNELLTNSTNSQQKTLPKTGLPIHWTSELFKKWQGRYGHKWTSAIEGIEKIAVTEWSEELAGVTGEQISYGLKEWKEDWPPSAPEFRKCCLNQSKGDWKHKGGAYVEVDPRKLLRQKCDPEKADNALAAMKGLFK